MRHDGVVIGFEGRNGAGGLLAEVRLEELEQRVVEPAGPRNANGELLGGGGERCVHVIDHQGPNGERTGPHTSRSAEYGQPVDQPVDVDDADRPTLDVAGVFRVVDGGKAELVGLLLDLTDEIRIGRDIERRADSLVETGLEHEKSYDGFPTAGIDLDDEVPLLAPLFPFIEDRTLAGSQILQVGGSTGQGIEDLLW